MIKILKKRILSNKGFSYVILSVLMIVILLMGVAIFEINQYTGSSCPGQI